MERYTNNNTGNQINETVFHSNAMIATNQLGQLYYVTTGQKQAQGGIPTASTITTAASQTGSQLHLHGNIASSVCSSSTTTSHNTAGVYAKHVGTSVSGNNQSHPGSYARHTNTPPKTPDNASMAESTSKSFQNSNVIYQTQQPQDGQKLAQRSTVLMKTSATHSSHGYHQQNSHTDSPVAMTTTTTSTTASPATTVSKTGSTTPASLMVSHQEGKPYYHCDICLKPFAQRHYLAIHKRSHTGEKPFQCDFCIQKFARRDTLQIHRRIHTGEKPFHCEVCSKQFAQRDKLQIHRRTHSRKKQFHCDICFKQFAQRDYVEIHKRSHTGEKPFECDFCMQKFVRKNTLDIHRRMHTGERPYHCEICGERFAQTDKLRRHKKSAHGLTGGVNSTGGTDSGVVTNPGSDPSTSSPDPVPTSNMVALAAASSKIIEDYPTINNQLWLL